MIWRILDFDARPSALSLQTAHVATWTPKRISVIKEGEVPTSASAVVFLRLCNLGGKHLWRAWRHIWAIGNDGSSIVRCLFWMQLTARWRDVCLKHFLQSTEFQTAAMIWPLVDISVSSLTFLFHRCFKLWWRRGKNTGIWVFLNQIKRNESRSSLFCCYFERFQDFLEE